MSVAPTGIASPGGGSIVPPPSRWQIPRYEAATESTTRTKLDEVAAKLTTEQIAAIHEGLKLLATMDRDHAATLNGVGYSKMDSQIGHSLAEAIRLTPRQAALGQKIVHRYRRQLGDDLVAVADGKL